MEDACAVIKPVLLCGHSRAASPQFQIHNFTEVKTFFLQGNGVNYTDIDGFSRRGPLRCVYPFVRPNTAAERDDFAGTSRKAYLSG